MSKLLNILILTLLSITAKAQDWIFIDSSVNSDIFYVKSTYVTKRQDFENNTIIKVWTKREAKVATIVKNGKEIKVYNVRILQLKEYNCTQQQTNIISQTVYNSQGKIIDSFQFQDYEQKWNDVVPESIGQAVLDKVCELFNE
jgi:hypothetical protein